MYVVCEYLQDLSVALYKHLQQGRPSAGPGTEGGLHMLGFDLDEMLIQRARSTNPFPGNISFITLDIMQDEASRAQLGTYLQTFGRCTFHLSVCLAVTMWVHLNHGDVGLMGFLSRLAAASEHLLLEAQPWKCYRSAARRLRKLGRDDFEHFKSLEIRGDMAENVRQHLERNCDMDLIQSFGSTSWDRKLLLFRNRTKTRADDKTSADGCSKD